MLAGGIPPPADELRAAADTVFSNPEVDLGLPFTWNAVRLVIRELGPSLARQLVLTGRRLRLVFALEQAQVDPVLGARSLACCG